MQIIYLDEIGSTQIYLKELLKTKNRPIAVVANRQTDGIGSRENSWIGGDGNLFLSFALSIDDLSKDIPLQSLSIYFAYLMKEILADYGSKLFLKWPNDFYLNDRKIGGVVTNIIGKNVVCGIGVNLVSAPGYGAVLDVEVDKMLIVETFLNSVDKKMTWKQVFSNYQLEFYKNKNFFTHSQNLRISLQNVSLEPDGSIICNGERLYSLR